MYACQVYLTSCRVPNIHFFLLCLNCFMTVQIAFFVGVHMEESSNNQGGHGLSPEMRQLSTVGAVKIAVRGSSMGAGSSKS